MPANYEKEKNNSGGSLYYSMFLKTYSHEINLDLLSNNNPLKWNEAEQLNAIDAIHLLRYYHTKNNI